MRYSLLDLLTCYACARPLTCITAAEAPCEMGKVVLKPGTRVSQAGAVVGPVPDGEDTSATAALLRRHASAPADPDRTYSVVVDEGLLVCGGCGRWYPITGAIPELLPDHLRDWSRDRDLLERMAASLPLDLRDHLRGQTRASSEGAVSGGDAHKVAEISLPGKIEDPNSFFGPGRVSPFNPWNPDHSWHLVESFAAVRPLLGLKYGDVVIDMGSGYSWTTEWMMKSGYEAIGFDICRAYLEIGLQRIGPFRPHLFVADVENLPLRDACARAVLAFEAFHHIPDRPIAMAGFNRVLQPGCPVVLVEPGSAHEHAQVSMDVMAKYGTLEKGMDLADVQAYVAGLNFAPVEQHWLLRVNSDVHPVLRLSAAELLKRSAVPNQMFVIRKPDPAAEAAAPPRDRPFIGAVARRLGLS